MTKFHFEISGWHELDDEDSEMYATFTDEQKREYIERMKANLHDLMLDNAIDTEAPFEFAVKYEEVSE